MLRVGKEIAALRRVSVADLRRKYAEVFGESTTSRHKEFLIRRIIWRLQAEEEGGLSERARLRARELTVGSDVRLTAPQVKASSQASETKVATIEFSQDERLPMPGAVLTRRYKGQVIEVRVLPHGFEYEGEIYRTLSAIASKVTGTHWNGYHFFRLGSKGGGRGHEEG